MKRENENDGQTLLDREAAHDRGGKDAVTSLLRQRRVVSAGDELDTAVFHPHVTPSVPRWTRESMPEEQRPPPRIELEETPVDRARNLFRDFQKSGASSTQRTIAIADLIRARGRGISYNATAPLLLGEAFDAFVTELQWRVHNDFSAIVLTCGPIGTGKSSLSMLLCKAADPTWTPATRIFYTSDELLNFLEHAEPETACVYDEAVTGGLSSMDATTSLETKTLKKVLALARFRRVIIFLNAPNIRNVQKEIREQRADYWLEIVSRGLFRIFERSRRISFRATDNLGFVGWEKALLGTWDKIDPSSKLWVNAMAAKEDNFVRFVREARSELNQKREKRGGRSVEGVAPPSLSPRDESALALVKEGKSDRYILAELKMGAPHLRKVKRLAQREGLLAQAKAEAETLVTLPSKRRRGNSAGYRNLARGKGLRARRAALREDLRDRKRMASARPHRRGRGAGP